MAVPFSNTKLRVPLGFPSLLEGLSREVLRHQPKDIFGFAEKYFEGLLRKREETGTEDIAQLTSRLYDRYYNNQAYCRLHLSSSDAEQKKAAVTIQTEYRRHHAQLQTEEVRKEVAAVQIQSCYRGYRTRKALKIGDSGQQTWADAGEYPRECKRADNFISDEEASPEASIQTQSEDYTLEKSYQDQSPGTERSDYIPASLTEEPEANLTQVNTTEEASKSQVSPFTDQKNSTDPSNFAQTQDEASESNVQIESCPEGDETSASEQITEDC